MRWTDVVEPDRPSPAGAATPEEFMAAMRGLKAWSGLSYRRLERQAQSNGDALPRSTLTQALSHDRLPQEELVAAFARACGCEPAETDEWITTRRRIAAGAAVAVPSPALSSPGPLLEPPPPVYVPVILGRPRRTVLASFAAATAIGTAAGALIVGVLKSSTDAPARATPGRSQGALPAPVLPPTPAPGVEAVSKAPPPTPAQMRRPPAPPRNAPTVLYVGDSIGMETSGVVEYFVHPTGRARVVPAVRADLTLCDLARGTELPRLIARTKPRVIALQMWGRKACAGSKDDARRTVRQITAAAGHAGIPRPRLVWVLQQPDPAAPQRVRTLDESVYQAIADEHPGDLTADAGATVSKAASYQPVPGDRYAWVSALPCDDLERAHPPYCSMPAVYGGVTTIHPGTDPLRLDPPGAARYGRAIARTVLTALDR